MYRTYVPARVTSGVLDQLDRAMLTLRRFTRAPTRLEHQGIPVEVSSLLVLDAVDRAGGSATIGEVAGRLDVTHSTGSRLVGRAVSVGLVERSSSADDQRAAAVHLTGPGRDLLRSARAFRHARLRELLSDWPAEDVQTLSVLLGRFSEAAAEPLPERPVHR